MQHSIVSLRIAQALACLVICQTTLVVLLTFRDYFPPDLSSDFLLGRSAYFYGLYEWAFYAHIISGPFTLLAGLVLLSGSVRRRFPKLHRRLGRVQVLCILLLLAPSGLWMAWYAATGAVAGVGFVMLAIATAICAGMGWQRAVQRRFDEHRFWMLRCYVLLCSAVVLRKIGGLSEVLGVDGTYPITAWISWLLPLFLLESLKLRHRFFAVNR